MNHKIMGFEPIDLLLCLERYKSKYLDECVYHSKEKDIEMAYLRAQGKNYREIGVIHEVSEHRAMRRVRFCVNKIKFYLRQDEGETFLGVRLGEKYLDEVGQVVTIKWMAPFPDYICETRACYKNKLSNHNYIFGGITDRFKSVKYDFHGKPADEKTKSRLISALSYEDGYHYG